jgi:PAS domain S-box-containing protein
VRGADTEERRRAWIVRGPRVLIIGYFVVLVGLGGATAPALLATVRALDRQQHQSDPISAATNALLTGALNEETGIRGYVITAKPSFLEPFTAGTDEVTAALAVLVHADVSARERSDMMAAEVALREWRDGFANRVLADVHAGDVASARSLVQSADGKRLFDQFRDEQDRLDVAVNQTVKGSRTALRRDVEGSLLGLFVALSVGLVFAIALWMWWRIWGRQGARREQALADLAVLMSSVIEASADPIFAKDLQGRHLVANRARVASLNRGDPSVEIIGRRVDEFVSDELAAQVSHEDRMVVDTGEESRTDELLDLSDGPHVFVTTKNPLADSTGRRIGVVGVARDVTEERRLQADRERLYQIEHRLAATLQEAMLGNADLDDDRYELSGLYQPALEELAVGGDWYDVVRLPNDTIGLVVGDAVGRGVSAATAMGQLRSALSALALSGLGAADVLEAVDSFAATIPDARSATCVYVILDAANEEITYSVAGHMPPLLLAADGTTTYLDDIQDPPLAASRTKWNRRSGRQSFPVGSTLVLFTDGLIERRTESIDVGLARFAAAAREAGQLPVREMCEHLVEQLLAAQRQRDDLAVLAVRLVNRHADQFDRQISADATSARGLRHQFGDWIADYHLGSEVESDLGLALGEALANAVEHAYAVREPGTIEVHAANSDGDLRVSVRDYGRWRPPHDDPTRGRGFALMRQLVDDVTINTAANGTTVELRYRVRTRSARDATRT